MRCAALFVIFASCAKKAPVAAVAPPEAKRPEAPVVCLPAESEGAVREVAVAGTDVKFCLEGETGVACYAAALADGSLTKADQPAPSTKVTVKDQVVSICETPDACLEIKTMSHNKDTVTAAAEGDVVAIAYGTSVELWSVKSKKKNTTIKLGKGGFRCGTPQILGDAIYVNAAQCDSPTARGTLYNLKGKRIADVGGKNFGTFGARAVSISGPEWAFLEESGQRVVIQNAKTGAVTATIDLTAMWGEGNMGNPGESGLARTDGGLVVVAGSPRAGALAKINLADKAVTIVEPRRCQAAAPTEPTSE